MTTNTPSDPFYGEINLHNPCVPGTDQSRWWSVGALNGRANRLPPTEHHVPAYYEGWHWGREWGCHVAKADEVALEVAEFKEWYDHESPIDEDSTNDN